MVGLLEGVGDARRVAAASGGLGEAGREHAVSRSPACCARDSHPLRRVSTSLRQAQRALQAGKVSRRGVVRKALDGG